MANPATDADFDAKTGIPVRDTVGRCFLWGALVFGVIASLLEVLWTTRCWPWILIGPDVARVLGMVWFDAPLLSLAAFCVGGLMAGRRDRLAWRAGLAGIALSFGAFILWPVAIEVFAHA